MASVKEVVRVLSLALFALPGCSETKGTCMLAENRGAMPAYCTVNELKKSCPSGQQFTEENAVAGLAHCKQAGFTYLPADIARTAEKDLEEGKRVMYFKK